MTETSDAATSDRSNRVAARSYPGRPVRASRRSAEWCLKGVDRCWSQKQQFIAAAELDGAKADYEHARRTYRRLLADSDDD